MNEWVKKNFSELGYTYNGLSGKTKADFGSGAPYIPYMNIFSNEKVNVDAFEYVCVGNNERQNAVKVGDALFTTSSETPEEVGMSSVLTKDAGAVYLNSFCFGLRFYKPSEFIPEFLAYALRSFRIRHQMFIAAQGSTRHNLSKENFNKMTLFYPTSLDEQRHIADILTSADEAITASRTLVEKYTAIKHGLMGDLLDKGKHVKISSFATIVGGSTPNTNDSQYWDGSNVWITPTDLSAIKSIFIDTSQRRVTDAGVKKATGTLIPKNTVIISCRAPVGYCAVVTTPFAFNQGCKAIIGKGFNSLYLYYQLSRVKDALERVSSGTTFLELPKKELERFEVTLPTLEEQCRIANILTAADTRLTIERNHLQKLENIKRGLMDDLLTNKVRTDSILHKHTGRQCV